MSLDNQESPRRDGSSASAAIDLFLSYNSRDRAAVQQVLTLLGSRGVSIFYDRESLGLGLDWFEPLERALGRVRGVVVLLGPNGLGRWQRREMALALDRQTREATFPVIPVLLPESEAGDYSSFLLLNTYADLRGGLNDPDTLDAIMRAVRDPATGEEARTISPPEAATICPYRGLNAFREEDAPLFFGRDRLVDEPEQGLLHKVLTCPLVAVVGASGSGKSSVVRAGLLPRLRREPPSRGTWDTVVFRPGKYPFFNLAIALEAARNPETSDAARETDAAALGKGWSSGDVPLELSLGRAREALRADRLLVVVDQFEELVTLTPKDDRQPFLSHLLAATGTESKTTVLLTLRADYYGLAIGLDRGLCDGIQRGLVNVGAMTRDERRAAIEGPARRVGLEFEPGLVDRLLDDVGDEPGNLPLLEFALTELWERREERRLTSAAYDALGRVAGAIGRRADAVFAGLTGEQQAAAPRLFGRLVRVTAAGEEGADTRQRVRLGDLDEASHSAVEPFVAGRLLVTARDPGTSTAEVNPDDGPAPAVLNVPTTVEVAHEALIRRWERLRGWLKEDRAFLLWRQRLGFQIAEWERSGRDPGTLLRGALLKEAHRFARSRRDDLNDREREFLARSESQSRRRLLGIAVITILAIGGGIEFYRYQRASDLFEEIQNAELGDVPRLVKQLTPYRSWANRWLARSLRESKEDSKEHYNSSLALLPIDASQVAFLEKRLLKASIGELPVLRDALEPYKSTLTPRLWSVLDSAKPGESKLLPAASALAQYDPVNTRWAEVGGKVSQAMVSVNPADLGQWLEALRDVRGKLMAPLATIFRDKYKTESERTLATSILADYASDQPNMLADLLLDAAPEQFAILFPKVRAQGHSVLALLESELAKKSLPGAKDDEKDRLAQRQAKAAVVLICLDRADKVWPLLRHSPDPGVRSYLVNWLKPLGAAPKVLMTQLESLDHVTIPAQDEGQSRMDAILVHPVTSVRRALILALGEYEADSLPPEERAPLMAKLLEAYRNDPDAGVHGATEWVLRRWKQEGELRGIDAELKGKGPGNRRWYVNDEGQTLAIVEGPVKFQMGSPPNEPPHIPDDEESHPEHVNRQFAIATKEVTVDEFQKLYKKHEKEMKDHIIAAVTSTVDHTRPQTGSSWYMAAAYCNWLSEEVGIKKHQWCYEPNPNRIYSEGMTMKNNALKLEGYRLPTEAEWEYACRSVSTTKRHYGTGEALLNFYAWNRANSSYSVQGIGRLKPNDLGLFDMHGNVWEWATCLDNEELDGRLSSQIPGKRSVNRGGDFDLIPPFMHTAHRNIVIPSDSYIGFGIRPAHTCLWPRPSTPP